ncbi:ead/Ea22-like family protein [Salmonella enterica]|nr:ead/Ea22-like family protein [Salmonella enterica]EBP7969331.1 ead/Ea22-like family protein [Salmonella enterica]
MSNIDKQALRKAAEKADSGEWSYEEFNRLDLPGGANIKINGRGAVYCLKKPVGGVEQSRAVMAFIAAFNPKVALALLDELEHYKSREERVTKLVLDNSTSWDVLYEKLEAAEKRIAEQREYYEGVIADGSKRIAELEARTVTLPQQAPENLASVLDGYEKWLIATTFRDTWNVCLAEVTRMNAAGIKVKES